MTPLALLSTTSSDVARGVHMYFSDARTIVAPLHRNLAGIYYEQSEPIVLNASVAGASLGEAFREAFDLFSIKDADLAIAKKSDWPAYRVSGLRSMRAFEGRFRRVSCFSLNSANVIVSATTVHPRYARIELSTTFNPKYDAQTIGERILHLVEVAIAA